MSLTLPDRPNLDHLKKQAKALLSAWQRGDAEAVARFRALASTTPAPGDEPKLADAQHVIAHEYGFETWAALKARVEALSQPFDPFEALKTALRRKDASAARKLLTEQQVLRDKINQPLPDFNFESTALLGALSNREMLDVVLDAGADINVKSGWWAGGFGVLDNASPELAPYLISRGARLEPTSAARLGRLDDLKAMIAAKPALVHARGGDGQTPLHRAATVEIAEYLLANGAEIDARDVDHESTPAQYAIGERTDVARYLVSRGAWSDILMAAALGDRALVERHLAADPGSIGTTVSDEYFPRRNPHAGGTIYTWTLGAHKTAHLIARDFHHDDIFHLLMDRSPDDLQLAVACEVGDQAWVQRIAERHPDLATRLPAKTRRKLPRAAEMNNARGVQLMLIAGWPVETATARGQTALHWAGFHGNLEMTRDLIAHQAPLDAKELDHDGTPLDWALYGCRHGWFRESGRYPEVVEAMLQAGATIPASWPDLDLAEPVRAVLRRVRR